MQSCAEISVYSAIYVNGSDTCPECSNTMIFLLNQNFQILRIIFSVTIGRDYCDA